MVGIFDGYMYLRYSVHDNENEKQQKSMVWFGLGVEESCKAGTL